MRNSKRPVGRVWLIGVCPPITTVIRDKTNLDIFWLRDESLEDTDNLPAPEVLGHEIVEQLEAALEEFRSVEEGLAGTAERLG